MTDTITLPRVTVQQALAALESGLAFSTHSDVLQNLRAALKQQAEPVAWPHKWGCRANAFGECSMGCTTHPAPTQQQAEPVQEPFDDLATELFVVAQISPADDGFSDTIDRIESWLQKHFSTQPQRKPLTEEMRKQMKEQRCDSMEMCSAFIDGWLSAEAAHGIKENT